MEVRMKSAELYVENKINFAERVKALLPALGAFSSIIFIGLFGLLGFTGCELLQNSLSSEMQKNLEEERGTASIASNVWCYNGMSSDDMSQTAEKLGPDYYGQSLLINFGKKVALSALSGSIELKYTDADGCTAAKTFSSLSGTFTDDFTGYRIDMSPVLRMFDTVTVPAGSAVMNIKVAGFVCAEGKQNGRPIPALQVKNIVVKPLFNSTAVDFSTVGFSADSVVELDVNTAVELTGGTYTVSGTASDGNSYAFDAGTRGNTITLSPKFTVPPSGDGVILPLTLHGIKALGAGDPVTKEITIKFSEHAVVIDGKKDINFSAEKGALVTVDASSDQSAFGDYGYDVSTESDMTEVSMTSDADYLYIGVEGSLALSWNNPLTVLVSNGNITGGNGAQADVHAAETEDFGVKSGRTKLQPNVYISHQPGSGDTGTGAFSAYAFVSGTNTDISASVPHSPEGWTSTTSGSFIEYAVPLGATSGINAGDTVTVIVAASLGWSEGFAVVDAVPDNSVTYNNADHTSVKYELKNGISYTIPE